MEELFAVYPGNPYPSTLSCRYLQLGELLIRPSKEGELLLGPVIVFRNTVMLVPGIGINFRNGNRFPQIDQQAAIFYIILKKNRFLG